MRFAHDPAPLRMTGVERAKKRAELCAAWTLRLRSGQAREGARPHTSKSKRNFLTPRLI